MKLVFSRAIYLSFILLVLCSITMSFFYFPITLRTVSENMLLVKFVFYFLVGIAVYLTVRIFREKISCIYNFNNKKHLTFIILITAIPRIIWISCNNVIPISDFNTYHIFADALSKGKVIGHGYIAMFPNYISYPAVLSVFYHLFGSKVIVAQLLNVVLSCCISLLIYHICHIAFSNQSGFIAGVIWALWPSQIFYTTLICTEFIFTCMMLLFIYMFLLLKTYKVNQIIYLISYLGLGALLALVNSLRPLGLIILATLPIYLLLEKNNLKQENISFTFKLNVFLIILIGYLISSYFIGATVSKIIDRNVATRPFGYNLYVGLNINSSGTWNINDSNKIETLRAKSGIQDAQKIHDEFMKMSFQRLSDMTLEQGFGLAVEKFKVMWISDIEIINYIHMGIENSNKNIFNFFKYENVFIKVLNFYYYAVLALSVLGVYFTIKNNKINFILFCSLIVIGIALLHLVVEAAGRYRFPSMTFFSIISGYGLCEISLKKRK